MLNVISMTTTMRCIPMTLDLAVHHMFYFHDNQSEIHTNDIRFRCTPLQCFISMTTNLRYIPMTLDLGVHHFNVMVSVGNPSFDGITKPSAWAKSKIS